MRHSSADGAAGPHRGPGRGWAKSFVGLFAVFVVGLLAVPSFAAASASSQPASLDGGVAASPSALAPVTSIFELNSTPIYLSPLFWGTTVTPRAHLLPLEGALVNATPSQVIVWPGGSAGDDFNPLTNTIYSVNTTTNAVQSNPASTSEAQFAAWCRSINCSSIMEVPGQIDNASLAAEVVNYTEKTLGLHPKYWEIGNEPERWTHWGLPWNQWNVTDHNITPTQYAWEVRNYTLVLREADPSIKILGIPATARPNGPWPLSDWVNATVAVNARNISGVAFHDYPAGAGGKHSRLTSFYGVLNGPPGLPERVGWVRNTTAATLAKVCPTCAPIPVFVTEVGSALSHYGYAPYSVNFAGALDMAAQMTQAMSLNLTNQDIFGAVGDTSNSWFNLTGAARPDYITYSQILHHLGPEAFRVRVTGYNHTVFSIATTAPGDHNRQDLLVVNLNLTSTVTFAPAFAGPASSNSTESWQWNGTIHAPGSNGTTWVTPATLTPVTRFTPSGLPNAFAIPPQGLVLFESYPSNSTPVRFTESGLPSGTRWFVDVAGTLGGSTNSSQTFLLPPGDYSVTAPAIPFPLGGFQRANQEQLQPFVSPDLTVGQSPLVVPVPFVDQWRVNITADPSRGGTVVPAPTWANADQNLTLTAVPSSGYLFSHWFGWGAGSSNATSTQTAIFPTGPISERAIFEASNAVTFTETGLPSGGFWSVALKGTNLSGTSSSLTFVVANGTYGYRINDVPGYRAHPATGSVNMTGTPVQVPIAFERLTPPGSRFLVTFVEMGLPFGTRWSILVRNASNSSTSGSVTFEETNGSYGYRVGLVPGYRAVAPSVGFVVRGAATSVTVSFERTMYLVVWNETGLWKGLSWEVSVNRIEHAANGSWVSAQLANGTYSCLVGVPTGWEPRPVQPQVTVAGANLILAINITRSEFAVTFFERGLPSHLMWGVRFADENISPILEASEVTADTRAPNGTYTFDVDAPSGYFPTPSHGLFTVHAGPSNLTITFLPSHPAPIPSIWFLGPRAIVVATVFGLAAVGGFLLAGRSGRLGRTTEADR